MHVLFLTFHLPHPNEPGAARPWEELRLMQELGYGVTVITASTHYLTGEIEKPVRALWRRDVEDGVTVIRTWSPTGYRVSHRRRLLCYLAYSVITPLASLAVRRVDTVFSATDPPFMTPGALLASLFHRARLALDERDMYPETLIWLGITSPRIPLALMGIWSRWLSRRASSIVTVSPGFVRLLEARGVDRERITFMTNYFPEDEDEPSRGTQIPGLTSTASRPAEGHPTTVLYAGGLGQATEVPWMLEAAQLLKNRDVKDVRFVVVGAGERKDEYETFCRQHGLTNVEFWGARPRSDMPGVYAEADIAIHMLGSQWRNSLSSKIFEYMAHDLPIIFSGEGDIVDVLSEAEAGIVVPPGDTTGIAGAIMRLAECPEQRRQMGERARAYVRRRFQRDEIRRAFARAITGA